MTYIPTISPITSNMEENTMAANYARCVVTAAALRNSRRALSYRMASWDINFGNEMDDAVEDAYLAAEAARPPKHTLDQVNDDITQQAFLLLTRNIAEYHDRIKF